MSEIFLKIVNMSISASWIVVAVLLLRFLNVSRETFSAFYVLFLKNIEIVAFSCINNAIGRFIRKIRLVLS